MIPVVISATYHFGQVPHLVFAVLYLSPAMVDFLRREKMQQQLQYCSTNNTTEPLNPSIRLSGLNPQTRKTHCWSAGLIWQLRRVQLLVVLLPVL